MSSSRKLSAGLEVPDPGMENKMYKPKPKQRVCLQNMNSCVVAGCV